MKILVATNHLHESGGTENYTYFLIQELLRKGHSVQYFCHKKGRISEKIKNQLNVSFFNHKKVDLILANHTKCIIHLWKYGYIIQTCHGIFPSLEQPFPGADAYVAISEEVKNHLKKKGYESQIIRNGINLQEFRIEKPVNATLKKVLSLCQSEKAHTMVQKACGLMGAQFMRLDKQIDNKDNIVSIINSVDLVVGLGRSAYDAMACGRPVVVFDSRQYMSSLGDGYILDDFQNFIKYNCSGRARKKEYNVENIVTDFNSYSSDDSIKVRKLAEKHFDISYSADQYLNIFNHRIDKKGHNRHYSYLKTHLLIINYKIKKIFGRHV